LTLAFGDSAYPPPSYPAMVDGWAFYIGGNTPHPWSDAEVAGIPCRYLLPIFTRSTGGDPAADAAHTIAWCRAHKQPPGTLTALDFEDRVAPGYLAAYDEAVLAAGWLVAVYGQQSTILGNPRPSGGYWVANWDQDPAPALLRPGWAGRQYAGDTQLGRPWDLSIVNVNAPLWDTRGAGMSINWSDVVNGPGGRPGTPGGNRADWALTDLGRLRDYLFGDKAVVVPPGSPLDVVVRAAQAVPALVASVADLQAKVAALGAPSAVDVPALAAALAATLGPALTTAATAGAQISDDLLVQTLESHIGAALTAAAAKS